MKIDFDKYTGSLVPAIVQDSNTRKVLMLGFMNEEAFERTMSSGLVTFFSRSRNRLWVKGETSGNHLTVREISKDCDSDTLLIKATPSGPVCHTGSDTCFGEKNGHDDFLFELEATINERKAAPIDGSYTSELFRRGINMIAQKVGEEAVELIIEAKDSDENAFQEEAADLLYHFLVLLSAKDTALREVILRLEKRHAESILRRPERDE
ncbi:MAG: bifunctional phosphoribosyl-AMP cyclohydrolase/phosphoribosyl-ATP diphosphatase HisIE [Pyrinomonadaceae bacterium]